MLCFVFIGRGEPESESESEPEPESTPIALEPRSLKNSLFHALLLSRGPYLRVSAKPALYARSAFLSVILADPFLSLKYFSKLEK